ncbi:acyl transferase domain-containing protein/NADPH:quinone reductase-like Zn-dependent oxidoreductase/acyl carrier protein [Nocardia transvalensis]|uniref:Acyl transferase domain-containing protein/NADPH:quinone reductase-like Zn-dependent oxidoreductase/acyl carrier protein n=1 Tax=Nocardia transvalensis TaxID=37333 RepID=A0A7W9UKB5_9NOCA|nr:type I polyketide synthase [Nocardia transvalensis]MBB5916368.1 acyl transferase domain-containing protein/NADPH:quinone reductase-like Zn-dependent oxidoreductase/acyl carrier protein [Nocardia transvalensis]
MSDAAIVGIGCRFPGGIDGPATFWDFLIRKGDGIVEVPPDRWSLDKFYDPDPDAPGRMYTRHGGFLAQSLWEFDADFFGISQREASIMDPQQRLLLEVAWEALDDGGMAGRIAGRDVGVFVGGFMMDNAVGRNVVRHAINSHTPTSSSHTLLSARIAFLLDLHGPTMTIDTACSSSLVALHQAVRALADGDCESAIVGGTNAMLQPETFISMCKGRFLAVDGHCKSFDASADGYGRGEGAGAVILKPLDAALRDGDRIYAVVRGSGVNQDGRTLAIPVPNPVAQQDLARRVHTLAGIAPHEIGFVEAHGTGTPVGDPLELGALGRVYGAVDGRSEPLPVGSVKNNIGHTEAAAGVAGVIKAALTVHHGTVAPQVRLDDPNPDIDFDGLRLRIPMAPEPLRRPVVAVNSFGYGGTNAHVLIGPAPADAHGTGVTARTAPAIPATVRDHRAAVRDNGSGAGAERATLPIFPLSARSETALRTLAAELVAAETPADELTAAAWVRRAHHPMRSAFRYTDGDDLRAQLAEFAAGGGQAPARAVAEGSTDPVFVYSGMGPQWWGMGRALLRGDGPAARVAREVDREFEKLSGWSILDEMLREEADSRITRTEIAQPANFLLQAALTADLAERGVRPAVVVGHSVGEVTAAYVSGALTLTEAVTVSYHRSRLQATTAGTGAMLAVGLSEAEARDLLADGADVDVAAINSPSAVTLAGPAPVLTEIAEKLTEDGVFARVLRVEVPYHSRLMDPILDELRTALAPLAARDTTVPVYSTVTAAVATQQDWDAAYWCHNVRDSVRFADTVGALLDDGHRVFLEVGPHAVLSGSVREILLQQGVSGAAVPTLARGGDDEENLLTAVAELYRAGALDGERLPRPIDTATPHVALPRYPWQRRHVWTQEPETRLDRLGTPDGFAMLGDRLSTAAPEWEVSLSVTNLPWLRDHVVAGAVVLPGAAYLDAALSAVAARTGRASFGLESVEFVSPLVVDEHDVPVVRIAVEESTRRFTIRSRPATAADWTVNAYGRLIEADVDPATVDIAPRAGFADVPAATLYDSMAEHGLTYGPAFRLLRTVSVGADGVVAQLDSPPGDDSHRHLAHPAVIDAALQCFAALYAATAARGETADPDVVVPAAVAGIRWNGPLPAAPVVVVTRDPADPLRADIRIASAAGDVALALTGVQFRTLTPRRPLSDQLDELYYEPVWEIVSDTPDAAPPAQVGEEEALLVVNLGAEISLRAKEIANTRSGELVTVGEHASALGGDQLLALLRSAHARPGVRRLRLVVVAGGDLDGMHNVDGLARVAQAVKQLLSLDDSEQPRESEAPRAEIRAVVVTENALCLPIDRFARLEHAALAGGRRELLNELPAGQWRLVDTEPGSAAADVLEQIYADTLVDEVALRAGACWTIRWRRTLGAHLARWNAPAPLTDPDRSFRLDIPRSRLLPELALRTTDRIAPGPEEIEIRMQAVGLNYKDTLKVLGVLTERELDGTFFGTEIGMDGYGVVERVGSAVTGVSPGDEISVVAPGIVRRYVTLRPDTGATTAMDIFPPGAFDPLHCTSVMPLFTAEIGLGELARVRPGETVLVHGAAGGMGMAAVQVALRMGARVIATAGTDERRAQVRALGAHEVLNSRSVSFVDEVLRLTGREGVDVVYSSAPGEILQQNFRVAGEFGRIVDIGKADIYGAGTIDLRPFDRNLSFFAVDIDRILARRPEQVRHAARRVVDALFHGEYRPLPNMVFGLDRLTEAFETVARSAQVGRVVLDLREDTPAVRHIPREVEIDPAASYLVTGGFGAFGLATARHLVRRGVRHLVLAGRRGATTDAAREQLRLFTEQGVDVREERVDVADYDAVSALVARIQSSGAPLRGVIHAAGVVNNTEIPEVTAESLREIFEPKVAGAMNLDRATTEADVDLDLFVLYSSASGIAGLSPQLGYASANSVLDALAWTRRAQGRTAVSVDWGFMRGDGGMADSRAVSRYAEMTGYGSLDMDFAAVLLWECLRLDVPQCAVLDIDWAQWALAHRSSARAPRFVELVTAAGGGAGGTGALRAEILAIDAEQRGEVVAWLLAEQLAIVLGVDADTVDLDTPTSEIGLDSLMAMEFGARVVKSLGVKMSVLSIGAGLSLGGLGTKIAAQIAQEEATTEPTAP